MTDSNHNDGGLSLNYQGTKSQWDTSCRLRRLECTSSQHIRLSSCSPFASQGIGRGIAIQYAALGTHYRSLLYNRPNFYSGCSVAIVGRTPSAGEATLADMKRSAPPDTKARFKFIQADLSLVKGMHRAAKDIQEWAQGNGVQYLIQTQGSFPSCFPYGDAIETSGQSR